MPEHTEDVLIDLGHGVVITHWVTDNHGNRVGFIERHPGRDGAECMGSVRFDTPEARAAYERPGAFWALESMDLLTISPSVLCRACGNHGFIRNGQWVPA
jgi:hypothetical protein